MSSIRDWMTIAEGLRPSPRARLNEAILYRGDATKVARFDLEKTMEGALFGLGIYLTDSPVVAADYTFSKGSEHVVFDGGDQGTAPPTVRSLLTGYLRSLMDDDGWPDRKKELFNLYGGKAQSYPADLPRDTAAMERWYRDPAAMQAYRASVQAEYEAAMKAEYAAFVKRAKARLAKERDTLRVVKSTLGDLMLVRRDRTGSVARFNIPDAYLAKTLHAEQPLSKDVLGIIKRLVTERYGDTTLDMRDKDYEKYLTFDQWVENFRQHGTLYAWEYHAIGGKGVNPTLDEIRNGTNAVSTLMYDREVQHKFIAALQGLGYVGLEYQGGVRMGANNPRGGGGVLHRAFVLWDEAAVNGFRIDDHALPPDEEVDAGHLKGVRTNAIAGTRYGYH